MEGWPSGLRRTPGKRVGVKAPRGFESPSLRHIINGFEGRETWCIHFRRVLRLTVAENFLFSIITLKSPFPINALLSVFIKQVPIAAF